MQEVGPIKEEALSLFQIEQQLLELFAFREGAANDEERAAADGELAKYCALEVRKVDGIASAIRTCETFAEAEAEEAARHGARAAMFQARADRIKRHSLNAMEYHQVRVVETPANRLRIQANGGVEPLDIYNEAQVPNEYRDVTVTLPYSLWSTMTEVHRFPSRSAVSGDRVRAKLKANGAVPGARLMERGKHLRVE